MTAIATAAANTSALMPAPMPERGSARTAAMPSDAADRAGLGRVRPWRRARRCAPPAGRASTAGRTPRPTACAATRRRERRPRAGDRGERRGAQADAENERQYAEDAAAAVAHDGELLGRVIAAAEPVGGVGEPILVQRAGDEHAGPDGDQRRRQRRQPQRAAAA